MIAAYPFCLRDQELALKNVQWWNELGGCKGHQVVCSYDVRCDKDIVEAVGVELRKGFDKVWRLPAEAAIDGWPEGANYMFRVCAAWLGNHPEWPYFLWLEPDAIPLREGWLDALEAEYKRCGKAFLGDRVEVEDVPLHMSGVGIYQNPIYMLAGEAYRAHDTAWDMAAKDQIIPNAYFTELIEHAWRHPTFHDQSELQTQIAPQTILFHSSKDGSLIDLCQAKRGGNNSAAESRTPASSSALPTIKDPAAAGSPSPSPNYDIFIRTYPGDYQWLEYCLQSIGKFVTGFRKIWIVSPADIPDMGPRSKSWLNPRRWGEYVEWKVMNDETEDGYLAQQITKLYADVLTDYQADFILHVDSDVIFTRPTTPLDFFTGDKMTWYYTPYQLIQTPWEPIIEKFMGFTQPYEFMRRLPMMIPRWLYPKMREFCHAQHGRIISEYIRTQPLREFSEFNALGAYAYFNHPDQFAWVNTSTLAQMPPPFAKQFHSWGGLTDAIKDEIEKILGEGEGPISGGIKVLKDDIWVLEGDQISGWIEQEGRLDHDQNFLPDILKHIAPGSTVVDVGAFIGDHTVAYSKQVGSMGVVYAFEPNPIAFQCLEHNTAHLKNVSRFPYGLSDHEETVPLSGNNGNAGGSYVGTHMKVADVKLYALETQIPWGADFIKIDVEGYELKVLRGAGNLINRYKPKMVIEINSEALKRQGATPEHIFGWLTQYNYSWTIIQKNCLRNDPMYDILAVPAGVATESDRLAEARSKTDGAQSGGFVVVPAGQPPQGSPPTDDKAWMRKCVDYLKDFAALSVKHRMMVRQRLAFAGLAYKTPKYKPKGKPKK
jgi:FkbM family methyltransferase